MKIKEITIKQEEQEDSLKLIKEIKELMKQGKAVPEVVIDGNDIKMRVNLLNRFDRYLKRKELEKKAKYQQIIAEEQENNSERKVVDANLNKTNDWKKMYQIKQRPNVNRQLNNYEAVEKYKTFNSAIGR